MNQERSLGYHLDKADEHDKKTAIAGGAALVFVFINPAGSVVCGAEALRQIYLNAKHHARARQLTREIIEDLQTPTLQP